MELGDGVKIESNNLVRDSRLGAGTLVHSNCHIEGAQTGNDCEIGPFARLRPGAELANNVKVGNFVEIKKSTVADGSKVNHLTYIGDTEIGTGVNVGAGTITCNYDGVNKHKTTIGDGAFIGSGVELVAPVRIGAGATVGAGATISKDVGDDQLVIERSRQKAFQDGRNQPRRKLNKCVELSARSPQEILSPYLSKACGASNIVVTIRRVLPLFARMARLD